MVYSNFKFIYLYFGHLNFKLSVKDNRAMSKRISFSTKDLIRERQKILEYSWKYSLPEFLSKTLETIIKINKSPVGFLFSVDDGDHKCNILAQAQKKDGKVSGNSKKIKVFKLKKSGDIKNMILTKEPLIHNSSIQVLSAMSLKDKNNYPAREMIIPVINVKQVVLLLAVAGKAVDYTENDLMISSFLADLTRILMDNKKKEEALGESVRYMNTLIDNLPGFAYRCQNDRDWTMEYISEGIFDICGYHADDFIYNKVRTYNSIINPADQEMVNKVIQQALDKRLPFTIEYRILTASGSSKWVWERGRGVYLNEELQALEGFVSDISEQHRDRERLFQLNRFYVFLSQLNQAIVRAKDKNKLFNEICRVAVSYGSFRMAWIGEIDRRKERIIPSAYAGYEKDYLSKINISTKNIPEGNGPAGRSFRRGKVIVSNNIPGDAMMGPWREEALSRNYQSSASIPFYTRGEVVGILNLYASETGFFTEEEINLLEEVGTDITYALEALRNEEEHKIAEEELRLQSAAMNAAANAIVITDRNGSIQWVNPSWTKLTGYKLREVLGKNPRILKSGIHVKAFYKDMWDTILSGKAWHKQIINRKKDESLYTEEMIITPVKGPGGEITHFIAVKQDISSRIKAEAEIRELNEKLELRVRDRTLQLEAANQELEAFAYSVSHDLRAPLRVIHGFAQILFEDYLDKLDAEGRKIISRIQHNVGQMGKLIDDLLTLSRAGRSELNRTLIHMNDMVDNLYKEAIEKDQRKKIYFKVEKLNDIKGDPVLLRQVWFNLLSNAIKFSSGKKKPEIHISSRLGKEMVEYCIRDNGAGFDMKYADNLFGVFQRLHSSSEFKGTGVGLAIVQRIIRKHGGQVRAEGEVNKGAVFYFSLPLHVE